MNIGCTNGSKAMFNKYAGDQEYWKYKRIEGISSCTKGLTYKDTYIDDMITLLSGWENEVPISRVPVS